MTQTYEKLATFHGHSCPGLAIGYRMSLAAMGYLSKMRSHDEELVAIVENDACGVDALQCLTGCTFGKGNLIFNDYGKHVYTLYCRYSKKGVRTMFNFDNVPENIREDRSAYEQWILDAPEEVVVSLSEVDITEPEPARVMESLKCAQCGEWVMVSKSRKYKQRNVCIPCRQKLESQPKVIKE